MSQRLQAAGRYKARIINHGVGTTKEKGLPQWVARFGAFEQEGYLTDANGHPIYDEAGRQKLGWVPLDDEYEIIDYLPLAFVNKDGQQEFTNTFVSLQEALGWTPDANDIFGSLQALDLSQVNVQIVVDEEEYQGKNRYKVQFVNPVDYEGGGVRQLDEPALRKLNNEWAAAFRAKFGAAGGAAAPAAPGGARPAAAAPQAAPAASQPAPDPSPTPAAPAAPAPAAAAPATPSTPAPAAAGAAPAAAPTPAPAAPAPAGGTAPAPAQPQPQQQATPSPAKPATQAPVAANPERPAAPMPGQAYSGGECSMEDAWAAFSAKKGNMTDDAFAAEWFREIADNFGARTDEEISAVTPAQWAWLRDHGDPIPF